MALHLPKTLVRILARILGRPLASLPIRLAAMMPLLWHRLVKTVGDQPPWRSLRLLHLAQKCLWQRPKSQQRERQSGAGTKAVTARGKNRVRQSVGKNCARRRLGLRVGSRTTAAAEAATATGPLRLILMKARKHWTPPVMAMCWKNLQISPLTAAMIAVIATANKTETAISLPVEMAATTGVSARAEMLRATRQWKLAIPRNLARANRGAAATIPVQRAGATAGAMPVLRTAKVRGQSALPSPKLA